MIVAARAINTNLLNSTDIFQDIFIPFNRRQGFSKGRISVIPVYSYRCIGTKENSREYYDLLHDLDNKLSGLGNLYLSFITSIPLLIDSELTNKTQNIWDTVNISDHGIASFPSLLKNSGVFPKLNSDTLNLSFEKAFTDIMDLYNKNTANISTTLIKNFCLKIISWANRYIPLLFQSFNISGSEENAAYNPKVLFYGDIKEHEIYFLILLSKLGSDVLYIHTLTDGKFSSVDKNSCYFYMYKLPHTEQLKEFPKHQLEACVQPPVISTQTQIKPIETVQPVLKQPAEITERRERTFEELATLSASTVMIRIYDRDNKPIGHGSGVIIDRNGLIVTNYHVINGGLYFGIVFEGMDESCQLETYTVVNANIDKDLALIKIHKKTTPIPIDRQGNVVRGQKVVAIGSPLGLMNTFSDGIISGFRKNDRLDFLQTTAPVSPGSSGGALLNMYGELIGITTAVFRDGQNMNIAVPSNYVAELAEQKLTLLNLEIMNNFYFFRFDNIKVEFDGFFGYSNSEKSYKVALYQCRYDRNNLLSLFKDQRFKESLEAYFIDNIRNLTNKYGIDKYDMELGAHNYMFYYSCHHGRITNRGWKHVNDD
jgi:S1-C subfamily serine protease